MKEAIATNLIFSPLGRRLGVIFYYEDGSTREISFDRKNSKKNNSYKSRKGIPNKK